MPKKGSSVTLQKLLEEGFTNRQVEESAKLLLDLGKLYFGGWVVSAVLANLKEADRWAILAISILGLSISLSFFTAGLQLFKGVKKQ
ncbi:MAG: hypothetical protein FJ044_02990 [Candidatus Cloacimonetes bacterium]|nr:hypothetical protein [Candidatus Cloacimonadota bacterium]